MAFSEELKKIWFSDVCVQEELLLTMYSSRHILLILRNIMIHSWYTYKQHNTRRIQPAVLLYPTITAITKYKSSPSLEKRSTCS
jgi:hypothetical protein